MVADKRYVGVLFAETAVSGPRGHGYFSNDDPNWFVWQDVAPNQTVELVYRALRSPLVTVWHVVARSRPAGKYCYRGAYVRQAVYRPDPLGPPTCWDTESWGMLLRRQPADDLLDLHLPLQDPIQLVAMRYPPHLRMHRAPLVRAKRHLAHLMLHYHDNSDPEAFDPYPDSVNMMVFDRQRAEFTGAEFFYPLLIDQVGVRQPSTPSPKLQSVLLLNLALADCTCSTRSRSPCGTWSWPCRRSGTSPRPRPGTERTAQ